MYFQKVIFILSLFSFVTSSHSAINAAKHQNEDRDRISSNKRGCFSAKDEDPFLRRGPGGVVYVRADRKLDGTVDDHVDGSEYVPLSSIRKIEWVDVILLSKDYEMICRDLSCELEWLNLTDCTPDRKSLERLAREVEKRGSLRELRIIEKNSVFALEDLYYLRSMIEHSPRLKCVDIFNIGLDDVAIGTSLEVLQKRKDTLETLGLGSSISVKGVRKILNAIENMECFKLRELSLWVRGDFEEKFDNGLIGNVLDKYPELTLSFIFNSKGSVDLRYLKSLQDRYGSRLSFETNVLTPQERDFMRL